MRNKLIKIITEAEEEFTGLIMHGKFDNPDDIPGRVEMIADKLIEDGWMRLPCKVGDKVYVVDYTRLGNMIFECEVEEISHFSYGTYYYLNWGLHIPRFKACQEDSFGKTVFLTREEAEQALKGGSKE